MQMQMSAFRPYWIQKLSFSLLPFPLPLSPTLPKLPPTPQIHTHTESWLESLFNWFNFHFWTINSQRVLEREEIAEIETCKPPQVFFLIFVFHLNSLIRLCTDFSRSISVSPSDAISKSIGLYSTFNLVFFTKLPGGTVAVNELSGWEWVKPTCDLQAFKQANGQSRK